ncbi:MAG: aminoglycoside phosphotransferase [Gammaproteobacteria bacterium]|nr:MAG: aminoglycoside phosphotransferase [Gammaproteobacteria bacterium]
MTTATTPDQAQDTRLQALTDWLCSVLPEPPRIEPASADASFRRYFRVHAKGQSLIAMDAPPEHEDTGPFIDIARRLLAMDLHVPEILEADTKQGFLLLTDLGSRDYLGALDADNADALYGDAADALVCLQQADTTHLPPYDEHLLQQEMALFRDWFLGRHLGIELDAEPAARLQAGFDALATAALEQPRVFVHRDWHSRNLMVCPEHNPGILDFQDAVHGPLTYDLVSLLRDCYIAWPADRVRHWALDWLERARNSGWQSGIDEADFLRWFDLMGIQRHLKAIGIFARLNHRDGKPGYLGDIPRTLDYIRQVAPRHAESRDLARLVDELELAERLS